MVTQTATFRNRVSGESGKHGDPWNSNNRKLHSHVTAINIRIKARQSTYAIRVLADHGPSGTALNDALRYGAYHHGVDTATSCTRLKDIHWSRK